MAERHGKLDKFFELLENIKGQQVACIYSEIQGEGYKGVRGKLTAVHPYDSITLDMGDTYDFLGERMAIVLLTATINGQQQELYRNAEVPERYPGYFNDPFGLITDQKEHLGYSVKEESVIKQANTINSVRAK